MGKAWAVAVAWWAGKKMIVGGGLVMAAGVAGVWYGKVDPVSGLAVVGFGLSIAGWSAKANRHQAELLSALQDVSRAAIDSKLGKAAVLSDLEPGLASLASVAAPALLAQAGATLHISTGTAAELALAIQHLAGNVDPVPAPPSNVTSIGGAAK
jgi:hypothetical protein